MTTTAPASDASASAETSAVRDWLRANAHPVTGTDADYRGTDLEPLTDRLAAATVVGLGESMRSTC
ncbi:hypothetical protein ACLMAL_25575 [Nocardia sp. CWNU-33]|uniref:hypothetical protein n=1 Tax=Nocardia sp. CWNU-33 TaxID=3392117 RepID=UPI00398F0A75